MDKNQWFKFRDVDQNKQTREKAQVRDGKTMTRTEVIDKERAKSECRANFFSLRIARAWNKLPVAVKNVSTVNAFKNALDKWLEERPESHN